MRIGFDVLDFPQWSSVLKPIYEELKRRGIDVVEKGRADFYVFCRGIPSQVINQSIYIPHGISPAELNSAKKDTNLGTRTLGQLLPGPLWLNEFRKTYPQRARAQKLVGWPKSDLLFSPKKERIKKEVREQFNLKYEKTVLWADSILALPIHQQIHKYPEILKVWKELLKLKGKLDVNLLIKPHIGAGGPPPKIFDLPQEMRVEGVTWVDPRIYGDIMKLFLVTDVLVTIGFSSVPYEFLLTDKPIVFWESRLGTELEKEVGVKVQPDHIIKGVEEVLSGHDNYRKARKKWREKLIYKPDGHASERAVDAIMELIG